MKSTQFLGVMFLAVALGSCTVQAQDQTEDLLKSAEVALKTGSFRGLAQLVGDRVQIHLDEDTQTYSRTQAEFVFKDFFEQYPATSFTINHQGKSGEGLRYVIGQYDFDGGSYSVLLLIKQDGRSYHIDTLEFDRE